MTREELISIIQDEDITPNDVLEEITDLVEVRDLMRKEVKSVGSCVCMLCNHKTIRYKRSLNKGQYFFLMHISSKFGVNSWVHYNKVKTEVNSKFESNCTDYAVLSMFGLLDLDTTKGNDGMVKLSYDGKEFLRGKLTIPKYIYVVNNSRIGESELRVNFSKCQEKFKLVDIF